VRLCLSERTKAVTCVHFAGYPAPVDRLSDLCAEHGVTLIEDAAHAPSGALNGRRLGTWGKAAAFSLFSNKVLAVGEGGLLLTDEDGVAELARGLRSHAMTSGSWDRHNGHAETYDVTGVGFNYRIDEPRSALALSRLGALEREVEERRRLTRMYRERLNGHGGLTVPYTDESVEDSCCYVMPILLRDGDRRAEVCTALRERHGVQTSIHFPPVHRFSAYRERYPVSLPRTEDASRREVTIPLFAHMSDAQLERVVLAIEAEVPG